MREPMTLDLLNSLEIVDDDVMAVVNIYLADPACGRVLFGEGFRIDPAAAVAEHPFAETLMRQPWANVELRQAAVRAAIMLSKPERV
jgi:hypothetical protein